jgi:perosamine synthetase
MSHSSRSFLPVAEPDLGPLEEEYILDALRSGWVSSIGGFIQRFEEEFARFCGTKHAVVVSNGTVAIHLALVAAGVGPGDEVIVPALTFVATAAAVWHAGAVPVFVDSEPEIGTLDPKAVERAISPKTKAIIPVHLYGHPADMDPILEIARSRGLVVIEDAAEAHGARYKGRVVGSLGHMATFSFYGNKILTTGEGGAVVTDNDDLAVRLRFLKDHAMDPKRRYWHPEVGFNYRMTNLQAAMGCAQLERSKELCAKRGKIVALYREAFKGRGVAINSFKSWAEPVPWLVCALLQQETTREERDGLMASLKEQGIDSRPYFHLLCDMPPYAACRRIAAGGGTALAVAEDLSARGLNLPSITRLSGKEVAWIAGEVVAHMRIRGERA